MGEANDRPEILAEFFISRSALAPVLASSGYCLANPGKEYLIYQPASQTALTVTPGLEGTMVGYGVRQYVNDPISILAGERRAGFDVADLFWVSYRPCLV